MSRTIRRKKEKRVGKSSSIYGYIHTIPDEWNGQIPWNKTVGAFPSILKEGKEYDKAYWWYHRDSHNKYLWNSEKGGKTSTRAYNKQELFKAIVDPEYVPDLRQFIDDRRWFMWD